VFAVERIWASKKFPCIHHLRSGESEHLMLMGFAKERSIIRNLTHHGVPVVDVYLTPQGFKWLQCLISLRSTEGLDLHRIKQLVCEVHHSIKQIIVFDQDVRLRDPALVQSALITRVRYETDLYLFPNERGSTLDPAYPGGYGCKLLVDATIPRERRTEEFQFQDV